MRRYKSIDIIRGLCMIFMVYGHIINWWLTPEDYWLYLFLESIFAPIGASGFLFISGLSAQLSYKNRLEKAEGSNEFNMKMVRNVYMFRALLLLFIAFMYNTAIAIAINDLTYIWAWFVLQTIGFCLILAWPLLKTSKIFRIILGIILLVSNEFILAFLSSYHGQVNFYGVLFHILYNPVELYTIQSFFTMFLIGTVAGEIIFDINIIDNENERRRIFKTHLFSLLIIGIILTSFGMIFLFPTFLKHATFSSMVYSLGIIFTLLSILIGIEEFEVIKTEKSYRFFYYYSYYSFTIFLAHNPLFFLFYRQLSVITIWIAVFTTMFLLTLLLRAVYKKLGPKASLKILLTAISFKLALKIEVRKNKLKSI